jgi:hypothetical protein
MDTETTGAENALPDKEATRKPGGPPPIVMTSTTNLIQHQCDLKDNCKGEHEFQNTRNGTYIIKEEMADYTGMKSYLEINNLHYFTFSPNSENSIKEVICHLPSDTSAKDISSGLEGLGFNMINVRQMTATRNAPRGNPRGSSPPIPCYLNNKCKISRDIQAE